MKDQKMPDGECHGRDLKDCGARSGVTDTYGAGKQGLEQGHTGRMPIGKDTKSDK